jgi:ribosomal protein L34E
MLHSKRCANDNHSRSIVTVRFCVACGEIVNGAIAARKCSELAHASRRRSGNTHCVDCGELLRRGMGR